MPAVRRGQVQSRAAPKKGTVLLTQLVEDMRALNSSIALISQKIKHIVRNEKILGRNLIVLNKKFKAMQEQKSTGEVPENLQEDLELVAKKLQENSQKIEDLQATLDSLKKDFVSAEELKELRYVIDSINPLEFATLDQVRQIVEEKIRKKAAKKEAKETQKKA